jgi:stearoyl-CoA desaturase (Delta-9 desaturase)
MLRRYAVRVDDENVEARDGTWAFNGGLNNHSRGANKRMRAMRVAKYRV